MFFSLFVILLTIVLFVILFDFLIRKYTNYGLAISMPGPYMYPIVGSLDFIGLSQGSLEMPFFLLLFFPYF